MKFFVFIFGLLTVAAHGAKLETGVDFSFFRLSARDASTAAQGEVISSFMNPAVRIGMSFLVGKLSSIDFFGEARFWRLTSLPEDPLENPNQFVWNSGVGATLGLSRAISLAPSLSFVRRLGIARSEFNALRVEGVNLPTLGLTGRLSLKPLLDQNCGFYASASYGLFASNDTYAFSSGLSYGGGLFFGILEGEAPLEVILSAEQTAQNTVTLTQSGLRVGVGLAMTLTEGEK